MNEENKKLLQKLLDGGFPDPQGRFGVFGGQYAPETLMPALKNLDNKVKTLLTDDSFMDEFTTELHQWAGRPTGLTYAKKLSALWGAEVYLKREDLTHT